MTAHALVLGLGNDLVADDGFGPAVARACRREFEGRGDVAVEEAAAAGLRLLDVLAGYRRALIVDVVHTGKVPPGTVLEWPLEESARAWTLGGSHQCDLATALALGRRLGFELPGEIAILVAEAADLATISEALTPDVAAAVPRARKLVAEWLDRTGAYSTRGGGTMKGSQPCPDCHGKGWLERAGNKPDEAQVCGLCNGSGGTPTGRTCSGCGGTGRIEVRTVEREKCLKCMGTGRFPILEDL